MTAMPPTSSTPRVAVIGAGIVGLATGYTLKQRGIDCRVYECGKPGESQSGGESRIFRHGHDDPRLVTLARESREIWREWERDFGQQLISPDGAISLGDDALDRLKVIEQVGGIAAHTIDSDAVAEALPILAWYDGAAKLDADGGAIHTRATIDALVAALGESLVIDTVYALRDTGRGIEVRAGGETAIYDRVIVCAGRGTAPLARGLGISLPIALSAHLRLTYETLFEPPARAASLQDGSGAFGETGVYAAPYPDRASWGVGLADTIDVQTDGGVVDPAALAAIEERTNDYVRRALPQLRPEPVGVRHCWVTAVPWSDDGVGVWQSYGAFFVAGHNLFKLAPVLGRVMADAIAADTLRTELRPESRLGEH